MPQRMRGGGVCASLTGVIVKFAAGGGGGLWGFLLCRFLLPLVSCIVDHGSSCCCCGQGTTSLSKYPASLRAQVGLASAPELLSDVMAGFVLLSLIVSAEGGGSRHFDLLRNMHLQEAVLILEKYYVLVHCVVTGMDLLISTVYRTVHHDTCCFRSKYPVSLDRRPATKISPIFLHPLLPGTKVFETKHVLYESGRGGLALETRRVVLI